MVPSRLRFPGGILSTNRVIPRNKDLNPAEHYQSILGILDPGNLAPAFPVMISLEQGVLVEGKKDRNRLCLITDIIGLMFQPDCVTLDSKGQVQFTDVSELFDSHLMDQVEKWLLENGGSVVRAIGAAVPAPGLLSSAEKTALKSLGAQVAVSRMYLEARAARARGVKAVGVAGNPEALSAVPWAEVPEIFRHGL